MKKTGIVIAIIVGIILIWGIGTYNGFVKKQEAMTTAWGQVENVYQRRADLVPNLVSVVKNYSEYEQGTLIAVTEARAQKAAATTVNIENYTESDLKDFQAAQDELGESLNRLIVSVENYADNLGKTTEQLGKDNTRIASRALQRARGHRLGESLHG